MKIPHYFSNKEAVSDTLASQIFGQLVIAGHCTADGILADRAAEAMCAAAEYTCIAGRARVLHASREDKEREHYCVRRRDFILYVLRSLLLCLAFRPRYFAPPLRALFYARHPIV